MTICLMGFLASFGYETFEIWSVLYFRQNLGANNIIDCWGYAAFHIAVLFARIICDPLRLRLGHRAVVGCSGITCGVGMIVLLSAGSATFPAIVPANAGTGVVYMGCVGCALIGLGLGPLLPIAFSAGV